MNGCMKEIHGGGAHSQGRWCMYKLSDEIRASLPKDSAVRQLHVEAGHKLRTYALFKEKPGLEPYQIVVKDVRQRQLVSMLRMGVLPLRIETGRYEACKVVGSKGVPVEFRVCKCCSLCKVEDEIHFLFECPLYSPLYALACLKCVKEK